MNVQILIRIEVNRQRVGVEKVIRLKVIEGEVDKLTG
jgi:hypothetical protein